MGLMTTSDWPETLELTLDGIAQGGDAVGRWGTRVVFATGGLPGERVLVQLGERHSNYARGSVLEVYEPAPTRVPPRVPGADQIAWQHIAYPAQLRFKREIVLDQLAKIGGLADSPVAETLPALRPWGYRNSARFHGEGNQIGYHAADTRSVRPVDHDPLALPVLNEALAALRTAMPPDLAPREVLLRASESYGYALAALHGAAGGMAKRWRTGFPALAGVYCAASDDHEEITLGAAHLVEELDGMAFQLRPTTFFQVNLASAEALLGLVRAGLALHGGERLLDLYCGAGTFALPLARLAGEVVGIEEFAGAVEDGRASAELNGLANTRFVAGRVEAALGALDGTFDAAVLDPPRRGCHPQAIARLIALAPARIVYVSCHPATLARDLKLLVAGGYRVEHAQPIDLFPQTAHIECVVVLVRG
ncbi:MAG: 23S rRNA (uracil(1939)-C(5))-methyltransferase RlmD [Kouleothrix sp.]|jgi:23S rRNA (uracil1939-C5)-methyltransferase|nr:23S rRNA (uracil(1939)-C(5))-methyltransferase RlmD [Kouleothrix sp.]